MLSSQIWSFNSPAVLPRHSRDWINDNRFVINCWLLGAHLIGQKALIRWLVNAILGIVESLLLSLIKPHFIISVEGRTTSSPFNLILEDWVSLRWTFDDFLCWLMNFDASSSLSLSTKPHTGQCYLSWTELGRVVSQFRWHRVVNTLALYSWAFLICTRHREPAIKPTILLDK